MRKVSNFVEALFDCDLDGLSWDAVNEFFDGWSELIDISVDDIDLHVFEHVVGPDDDAISINDDQTDMSEVVSVLNITTDEGSRFLVIALSLVADLEESEPENESVDQKESGSDK